MKTRLLSTVAASLLIGAGAAYAQSPNQQQAPERAPATQQTAPAEKVAPPMKKPETSGQAPKASEQEKSGSGMENSAEPKAAPTQNQKSSSDSKSEMNKNAADSNKTQNNAQGANKSTTGQGAASGQVKLSSEQRTKITTTIRSQKVERVEPSKLNISINVGTRIPSHVHVHPLPADVVTIYPEWRGYDYILVGEQIIIIEPRTHEIVYIIEA
jgi:hypothetical protein